MLRALALLLLMGFSGCCCAPECAPDRLPAGGVPRTAGELFALVQYAAQNECYEALYEVLSDRTQEEHSYFKLRLFLGQLRVPEPWEYTILDILKGGQFLGAFSGPQQKEVLLVEYQEQGKPNLLAQVLVVEELDQGSPVMRLALEEQAKEGPPIQQE